ncbi:DUF5994 family protein [Streptomyces sp. AC04842]|uniref:DUF5994 family protein n=1 Tax=Streptomyces sp. AC04842 TaxID=2775327 RepID=UPI0020C648C4
MTATILAKPAVEERPRSSLPPRLVLAPADTAPALIDGAWWPRSRDLTAELPALIEVLDPLWGRITRVTVNPTFWPYIPRKLPVQGHMVHVGWFEAEQDPHELLLLSYTVGRWDLLVIPPETEPATARRTRSLPGPVTGRRRTSADCDRRTPTCAEPSPLYEEVIRQLTLASDALRKGATVVPLPARSRPSLPLPC